MLRHPCSTVEAVNRAEAIWAMSPQASESAQLRLENFLGRPDWHRDAACRAQGTKQWFTGAEETLERAMAVCRGCPVRQECYDVAMADRDLDGTWGGFTAKERRELHRAVA